MRLALATGRDLLDARWTLGVAVGATVCRAWRDVVRAQRRRPAAAPASLRRCRDGWSDFF
ncbi:hypothetical protein F511_45568 [Dorcoceras hygrometricum]|uniref:Uncharacterized protein n=1 Tax=Dorcoceras hygrometricum TaxID=472368 RepID=A0A2Z6ZVV5_9LAMI|nr:hypothetical protein F511_45568 [Dorcoceras hygrometricum]